MGQAKTENRRRQADHSERILGHTSSSGTGVASPAASVSPDHCITSTHASGIPTVSTIIASSLATSRRLTASRAHRSGQGESYTQPLQVACHVKGSMDLGSFPALTVDP